MSVLEPFFLLDVRPPPPSPTSEGAVQLTTTFLSPQAQLNAVELAGIPASTLSHAMSNSSSSLPPPPRRAGNLVFVTLVNIEIDLHLLLNRKQIPDLELFLSTHPAFRNQPAFPSSIFKTQQTTPLYPNASFNCDHNFPTPAYFRATPKRYPLFIEDPSNPNSLLSQAEYLYSLNTISPQQTYECVRLTMPFSDAKRLEVCFHEWLRTHKSFQDDKNFSVPPPPRSNPLTSMIYCESLPFNTPVEFIRSQWPMSMKHMLHIVPLSHQGPSTTNGYFPWVADFSENYRVFLENNSLLRTPLFSQHAVSIIKKQEEHCAVLLRDNFLSSSGLYNLPTLLHPPVTGPDQFKTLLYEGFLLMCYTNGALSMEQSLFYLGYSSPPPSPTGTRHQLSSPIAVAQHMLASSYYNSGFLFFSIGKCIPSAMPHITLGGGKVMEPEVGKIHSLVTVLDVHSMYPSLIVENCLCFSTLSCPSAVVSNPSVSTLSSSSAMALDLNSDESTDSQLLAQEAKQVAIKKMNAHCPGDVKIQEMTVLAMLLQSMINARGSLESFYQCQIPMAQALTITKASSVIKMFTNAIVGLFGCKYSLFYTPVLNQVTTWLGRQLITDLISIGNLYGRVIYSDTDSIFLKLNPRPWIDLTCQSSNSKLSGKKRLNDGTTRTPDDYPLLPCDVIDRCSEIRAAVLTDLQKRFNYSGVIKLKLECVFYRICFMGKKRYFGNVLNRTYSWKDEKHTISQLKNTISTDIRSLPAPDISKGMDSVRRDLPRHLSWFHSRLNFAILESALLEFPEATITTEFLASTCSHEQVGGTTQHPNFLLFQPRIMNEEVVMSFLEAGIEHLFSSGSVEKKSFLSDFLHAEGFTLTFRSKTTKEVALYEGDLDSLAMDIDLDYYKQKLLFPPVQRLLKSLSASFATDPIRCVFDLPPLTTRLNFDGPVEHDVLSSEKEAHQFYMGNCFNVLEYPTKMSDYAISSALASLQKSRNPRLSDIRFVCTTCGTSQLTVDHVYNLHTQPTTNGLGDFVNKQPQQEQQQSMTSPKLSLGKDVIMEMKCPTCGCDCLVPEDELKPHQIFFLIFNLSQQANVHGNEHAKYLFRRCRHLLYFKVNLTTLFASVSN